MKNLRDKVLMNIEQAWLSSGRLVQYLIFMMYVAYLVITISSVTIVLLRLAVIKYIPVESPSFLGTS